MPLTPRTLGRTGIPVSPIGLGTTEIGYLYGLGERTLPTESEAIEFLNYLVDIGVTFIDTAHSYGLAEERIAKSGIAKRPGVTISTKCGLILDKGFEGNVKELEKELTDEVEQSLRTLEIDCITLLQFHGASVEIIKSGALESMAQKWKEAGKVKFVGVSVRGEDTPLAVIESGFFDTIQLAYSILDERMEKQVLPKAQEHNIGIINRSVLLKGALTPASIHLVEGLASLKQNSDKAAKIAEGLGTDLPSLAIRFVLSNEAVSTVIVGTNKSKHIENAVKAAQAGPLPEDVLVELRKLAIDDPMQIDPSKWKHWNQPRDGKSA